jgi:hypothetical protein
MNTAEQLSPAFVNEQFDKMAANYHLSGPEQTYLSNVDGAMDAYMGSMLDQQLAFGNLSLDDAHTQQAVASEKGVNALMASSMRLDNLGYSALMAMELQERQRMLFGEDDEDDDTDAEG